MLPVLIQVQPLDTETDLRTSVYFGSSAEPDALGLNGVTWEPAVNRRPRIAQDLASFEMDGRFKLATADLVIALNMTSINRPERLLWPGAPITIWSVADLAWERRKVEFSGFVRNAPFDVDTGRLTLNCMVDRTRVEKPLLTLDFTGAGGLFGETAARGMPQPAGFGVVEACEAAWFDTTYNIGMLDGYGNLVSVQNALEGLDDRGAPVANYPNYAALKAAIIAKTVPPGRWATSIADGLVGLGAPPAPGVAYRFHATFGTTLPGALMRRWMEFHAGVAVGDVDTASFAALDAAVPREVRCHFTSQVSVDDLIEQMCLGCNASPLITVQNKFAVTRTVASAPVATLNRNRATTPRVIDWRVADPIDPVWKIGMRAARPGSVTDRSEVLGADIFEPKGMWSGVETYRWGMTVFGPDGAEWLYINTTPTVGPALPTATYPPTALASDAYWQQLGRPVPTVGSQIGVADGATADGRFVSIGSQTATITGNSAFRPAGSHDYNACVRSTPVIGPQYLETDIVTGCETIVSLDDDATSFSSASLLLQFVLNPPTGSWAIYTGNTILYSGTTTAGLTGKIRLSYDGIRFRCYINAAQMGGDIPASASNLVLWPKWHIYHGTGIVYSGMASGPYTSNIWADEGGTGRPADNAGTTLLLVPISAAVEIVGNSIRRQSGGPDWTTGFNSGDSFTAGAVMVWRHNVAGTNYFIGLTDTWITGAANNYLQIDYAVYINPTGTTVYVNGTDQVLGLAAAAVGEVFAVTYDNLAIRLYKTTAAGVTTLLHTYTTTPGQRFYACGSTYQSTVVASFPITGLRFEPNTNQNWGDVGGTGVPASNAGTTVTIVPVSSNVEAIGNSIRRQTGTGWDAGWNTLDSISQGCFLQWTTAVASQTYMIGLTDVPITNAANNYNQIDYAAYVYTSSVEVYLAGAAQGVVGTWALGDTFSIAYDNLSIRLYKTTAAGVTTLLHTYATTDGRRFMACGTFTTNSAAGLFPVKALRFETFSNQNWGDIAGVGVPSDNAGTTINFYSAVGGQYTFQGNTVIRSAGGWGGNAYSYEYFIGTCSISSRLDVQDAFFGLSIDRETTSPNGYGTLDYAIARFAAGWQFYENGYIGNISGSFNSDTQWQIIYDGVNVTYYADGVLKRTVAAAANLKFYAGISLANGASAITNILFMPYSDRWLTNMGGRIPGTTNLPNIIGFNLGFKFTGVVSYTSAAGTPATATISVTAGSAVSGGTSIAYNALSKGVTGTGGTTVTYFLYVDDPNNAGGAQTLQATTTALTVYQNNGRVYIGFVDVIFPTSGSGGGGGSPGGGYCVAADSFVETRDGWKMAREIRKGDILRVLTADRAGTAWEPATENELAWELCYRIRSAGGIEVTVSDSTPITLRDGEVVPVSVLKGEALPVFELALSWEACVVEPVGLRQVARIRCNQKTFAAGDVAGRSILTHNPKP